MKMQKRRLLPISLGLASILIAGVLYGCAPDSTGNTNPAAEPASASVILNNQMEGIWVSGTGEVTVTPDIANLRLGIEAQEASVAEAQTKASEAMAKVMAALTDNQVAEEDIQTQYFRIRERTRWNPESEEEIVVGYEVSNMVVAKVRDIDKIGTIIGSVVEAGGDLIRIDSIGFSVDDPSVYYEEAREKAMADAEARAEHLAELAGVTLGKPTYISEGVQTPVYRDVYYEFPGGMAPPAPAPAPAPPSISPGELEVSLTVQVAYSILQ